MEQFVFFSILKRMLLW